MRLIGKTWRQRSSRCALPWPVIAPRQDVRDYFDLHHTPDDTLDKIDPKALDQNVAARAAILWVAASANTGFTSPAARINLSQIGKQIGDVDEGERHRAVGHAIGQEPMLAVFQRAAGVDHVRQLTFTI